jgi:outer membrane protein TolC
MRSVVIAAALCAAVALPGSAIAAATEVESFVRARLSRPLSIDDAVHVALLNNRGLQALYYRVTLSDSAMANAILAAGERRNDTDPVDGERRFILASTLPLAGRLANAAERRKTDRLRVEVAGEMLQVAQATRRAYVGAVAAAETARYLDRALESAEAGAELARRMVRVGNWPRLNELRQRAFHGEVAAQSARARQAAVAERERLTELLGLWGTDADYRLPERLPDLPANAADLPQIEDLALRRRADLQAIRLGILSESREWELDGYDHGELFAYRRREVALPDPDYFGENGRSARESRVPVFDRDQARRDPKLLPYVQMLDRYNETAIAARSQARNAYLAYRTAYDVARHYRDTIIPLRKEISEENLLRYNGMLISVFELLADARDQIASVTGAIEALREFWMAEIDLRQALSVGGGGAASNRSVRVPGNAPGGGH